MSITKDFEQKAIKTPGGGAIFSRPDVMELLAHTRALETMLKKLEWTYWPKRQGFCRACLQEVSRGHTYDCPIAKLLEDGE